MSFEHDGQGEAGIAIIGMAGRFPGAQSIDEFWQAISAGRELIAFPTDQELIQAGVNPSELGNPNYVKASARIHGYDLFDASFFGYSARQAAELDPQQRLFLECAWEALESAACNPENYEGLIGVYAGSSVNGYFLSRLAETTLAGDAVRIFQNLIDSDKDYLTTRASYKLDLTGPSVAVQTGCSTSLVAAHLACQSLHNYECDTALAGGVCLVVPHGRGYTYHEGGIVSPDGHCRAFDANALGTVPASGVAIVVLKRLADAIADGNTIHAVIRNTAINNDGARKVGYTAPSVQGQMEVIGSAQAGIDARSIGLIEAHGTGTIIGDAIELTALSEFYKSRTTDARFCALGSVKSNIGHLDVAAGVVGLIKAALCLEHKTLVPSLHFERPNQILLAADCPFYVNVETRPWPAAETPRRAAVSSFGIGGTNAHAVLEEAPPHVAAEDDASEHLIVMSAQSEFALGEIAQNLAKRLRRAPERLADIAYTLQLGRKTFQYRKAIVARHLEDLLAALEMREGIGDAAVHEHRTARPVAFLFPGRSQQWLGCAGDLYRSDRAFRAEIDRCAEIATRLLGSDVRRVICDGRDGAVVDPHDERVMEPALFIVECCLAKLWMGWGVVPEIVLGHGVGEYAAACIAGVFSIEDGIDLLCARARLLEAVPADGMIAVAVSEAEARKLLPAGLVVAAVNAPEHVMISGPLPLVAAFETELTALGKGVRRLPISCAFYSPVTETMVAELERAASRIERRPPRIRMISGETGRVATDREVLDPAYWARRPSRTVRFAEGVRTCLDDPETVFLEIGPGRQLSDFVRQNAEGEDDIVSLPTMDQIGRNDRERLLGLLGQLWARGVSIDWRLMHQGRQRTRLVLPSYPFERQRYWIEPEKSGTRRPEAPVLPPQESRRIEEWFHIPSWQSSLVPAPAVTREDESCQLVFIDRAGFGASYARHLEYRGIRVATIAAADGYAESSDHRFTANPEVGEHIERAIHRLQQQKLSIREIVYFWAVGDVPGTAEAAAFWSAQKLRVFGVLQLMQALAATGSTDCALLVITTGAFGPDLTSGCPESATVSALGVVAAQEYPELSCAVVDLPDLGAAATTHPLWEQYRDWISGEFRADPASPVVAYRGSSRVVRVFESVKFPETAAIRKIRHQGLYVITGGLGKLGLVIAEHIANTYQGNLLLVTRSPFPPRHEWAGASGGSAQQEFVPVIRRLEALEAGGSNIVIASVDVSDAAGLDAAVSSAEAKFGPVRGVFHLAGRTDEAVLRVPIAKLDASDFETQIRPKLFGLYALLQIFGKRDLDFGIAFSSNASILGGIGFGAYGAANAALDAAIIEAGHNRRSPWITTNWDGWWADSDRTGVGLGASIKDHLSALFQIVERATGAQIVVSGTPVMGRFAKLAEASRKSRESKPADNSGPPARSDTAAAPAGRTDFEQAIASIWEEVLGVDRVGVDDDFFDLGGDSLVALQVITRVREHFNIEIPVRAFLDIRPTVASLSVEVVYQLLRAHESDETTRILETVEDA
jgi:phthiocerol/phenolphthiocerol synthesis type-I polyketide synthase E